MTEKTMVGVDECSLGSWIGNVWAGAVMLDQPISGLNDSKKLSPQKRAALALEIKAKARAYGVGYATSKEVEEMGPLKASHEAMARALDRIHIQIDEIKVDGIHKPKWKWPTEAIVKGDTKIQEIMAASILAKVARTEEMEKMHAAHPEYGFNDHQGYGTKAHKEAIDRLGVLQEHRATYKPIAAAIQASKKRSMAPN